LGKKHVYEYERFSVDFPTKFRDFVEPFLNQNLDIDVRMEGNDKLVIIVTSQKNVSDTRKPPSKTYSPMGRIH
jgi:hypothetical protein